MRNRSAAKSMRRQTLALALAVAISGMSYAQAPAGSQALPSRAITWAKTMTHAHNVGMAQFLGFAPEEQPVSIAVSLKLQNEERLDAYLKDMATPGSSVYRQPLSSAQAKAYFAPTQAQADAVKAYLEQQGFTNVKIADNRMVVTAQGHAGNAQRAFHTTIGQFSYQGRKTIANTADIEIPASLSGIVQQVAGLQTMSTAHIHALPPGAIGPATGTYGKSGYQFYPDEFATVYHAGTTAKGTNTDVAIVGWGSMTSAVNDLVKFESDRKIAKVPTSIVTAGKGSSDNSGEVEWAMDAQAIVGISGGVKSLTFYTADTGTPGNSCSGNAPSPTNAEITAAVNQVVSDNKAKVVNMSWSMGDSDVHDGEAIGLLDPIFKLGVAQGQTFSAASGDTGSYPEATSTGKDACGPKNGSYGDKTKPAAQYPASSPYVVAVGGTTLNADTKDNYVSESVWPYGGGGISAVSAKPDWQSNLSGSYRLVPDVAFDADWQNSPAYFVVSSYFGTQYTKNGGTSLASPLFVGAWARLESANNNKLGFAAPWIYKHAGDKTVWLHDVVSGNNGAYPASTGWDNATGWGSFDIQAFNAVLAADLAAQAASANSSK